MNEDPPSRPNVLVAFKARNVRCYRSETTLSLQATRLANPEIVRDVATASAAPERVLPVTGVFGANASGKSAILKAMWDMRGLVLGSFRAGARGRNLPRKPFLLDPEQDSATSGFEVELVLGGVYWHYGFEIDDQRVLREFAYHYPRGRPALVFKRENGRTVFGPAFRAAGRALRPIVRENENALLLSIFGAAGEKRFSPLFDWWRHNLLLATPDNRLHRAAFTAGLAKDDAERTRILDLLHAADLGLADLKVVKPDIDMMERLPQAIRIVHGEEPGDDMELVIEDMDMLLFVHRGREREVTFSSEDESMGTQVWIGLVGPVLEALASGQVLLVDELDASLHPHLVARLIDLFQDPRKNPKCAQLVFNAHDTTILGESARRALGRDQIWFAEKESDGAARLYSLADFRPRRDESVERRYLHGRYGGVPELDPVAFERAVEDLEDRRSGKRS